MPLVPGSVIGTYRLEQQLGRGGQGSVWRSADPVDPSIHHALKLIRLRDATPAEIERIRREGHLLSSVRHKSIVGCQGIVEDLQAGYLALVMDLVDGEPLSEAMRDPRFSAGHREAVLDHIAGALAWLHESTVVHRDLKPENVMLRSGFWQRPTDPSMVKLVDFGIALTQGNQGLTSTGTIVGTLAYMPPEVLDPSRWPRVVAPSSADVWAFGVMGWVLLTGRHPTGLDSTASITDLARAYDGLSRGGCAWPVPNPGGRWGQALARCLVLSPANRLTDGRAILGARAHASPSHTAAHQAPAHHHSHGHAAPAAHVLARRARMRRALAGPIVLAGCVISVAMMAGAVWWRATSTVSPYHGKSAAPWATALDAKACPQPCSGGEACGMDKCPSKYTCIPGEAKARLAPDEVWRLHLSGVNLRGRDAYGTMKDAIVCVQRSGTRDRMCASLEDAHARGANSEAYLLVSGDDLTRTGIDVEVFETPSAQHPIARKMGHRYAAGLERGAICLGIRAGGFTGSGVDWVQFYLRPPP